MDSRFRGNDEGGGRFANHPLPRRSTLRQAQGERWGDDQGERFTTTIKGEGEKMDSRLRGNDEVGGGNDGRV